MNRHEGVSCDACLKSNFRGRRFKCLICYDYDLCANCHEESASSSSHHASHPMQCILTRTDFELYYGGEVLSAEQPQSFTCPYCNKMGLTDVALAEHVSTEHTDTSTEVVCPVCAAMQGGEPNFVTDDFAGHLSLEHRTGQRDLISFLDEPSAIRHGGVRRIPHSGRALGSQRSRRSNMHFSSSGALSTLSPSGRESVDPITELLSHLTSVRRGPQSSQLIQLQQQIQMERQQISAARQQLERLPRRHPIASLSGSAAASGGGSVSGGVVGAGATGLSATLNGNTFLQALTQQQQQQVNGGGVSGNGITISNFSHIPIAASSSGGGASAGGGSVSVVGTANGGSSVVSVGGVSGQVVGQALATSGSGVVVVGGNAAVNGQVSAANVGAQAGQTSNQSQFLLARLLTSPLDEKAQADLEVERADRAQFVQALVLSTIANLDSFRLASAVEQEQEQVVARDTATGNGVLLDRSVNSNNAAVDQGEERRTDINSQQQPQQHNNCTNNAVNNNKKNELEGDVGITNSVPCSDSRPPNAGPTPPPPVKPKPPTATKPVPHNLPNHNYTSERGAGRGGPSAAGASGGMKGRAHQQPQSNQGASSGGNAPGGGGGGAGGAGAESR